MPGSPLINHNFIASTNVGSLKKLEEKKLASTTELQDTEQKIQILESMPSSEKLSCEQILKAICNTLTKLIERNQNIPLTEGSPYHSETVPPQSISYYLKARFNVYIFDSIVTDSCRAAIYIYMLMIIDRYLRKDPQRYFNQYTAHRLVAVGLLLANKYLNERHYNNKYHGQVAGIPTTEMNALEANLLFDLNFGLNYPLEEFNTYKDALLKSLEEDESASLDNTMTQASSYRPY